MRLLAAILSLVLIAGCSDRVSWTEDVQLLGDRVIQVQQERRCEGGNYRAKVAATCIARESWLTFTLPEFSSEPIVWREGLAPMVLNVHDGKLFVVGYPPTTLEFRKYGASNPPYVGYVWENKAWRRIEFREIPVIIYDGNLLIENIPKRQTDHLTLAGKASENSDPTYPAYFRRIDPAHRTSPY